MRILVGVNIIGYSTSIHWWTQNLSRSFHRLKSLCTLRSLKSQVEGLQRFQRRGGVRRGSVRARVVSTNIRPESFLLFQYGSCRLSYVRSFIVYLSYVLLQLVRICTLLFITRLGRPLLRYFICFYMQAAMPALITYYMYVSTFVWLMPYVRSMIASLLVKMPIVLLYFIIYSYLHVCIFTLLS